MKLARWKGWTDWLPLLKNARDIPCSPGAYMIAAHKAINRAVGEDVEGILDIGESVNLRKRIRDFIGCAQGTRQLGHMAGWRYHEYDLAPHFPLESLFICWHTAASKPEAYALEGAMLKAYLQQHKELPPLNYKFNWPTEEEG